MDNQSLAVLHNYFIKTIKQEHAITKRVIVALPDTNHEYRPDPKSKSGAELAWHLAASELWFLECILKGEFGGSEAKMPKGSMSGSEIAAWYEEHFSKVLSQLERMSPQDYCREISFFGIATLPAVMFLGWTVNHAIHHRGQLSAYLRAMGGKVPQIYGGSADVPMKI